MRLDVATIAKYAGDFAVSISVGPAKLFMKFVPEYEKETPLNLVCSGGKFHTNIANYSSVVCDFNVRRR